MKEELKTIDAQTLMATDFPEQEFLVGGLISQGVTILSGPSKIGKSWLVLWMALRVSEGQPVWDGFPTMESDVLYLCLEDNLPRLQRRLAKITADAPPNLHFANYCGKIGDGLEDQIAGFLNTHPETRLVIIDTFQLVRNCQTIQRSGIYATDYDDISALKRLADERKIAIILVHHLRKLQDRTDPFNEISGSTGIMGAADTSLVLKKPARGSTLAKLHITGRDVEDQTLRLEMVECVWWPTEKEEEPAVPPFIDQVIEFMQDKENWEGTVSQLLAEMGVGTINPVHAARNLREYADTYLRDQGLSFQDHRTGNKRLLRLEKMPEEEWEEVEEAWPEQEVLDAMTV